MQLCRTAKYLVEPSTDLPHRLRVSILKRCYLEMNYLYMSSPHNAKPNSEFAHGRARCVCVWSFVKSMANRVMTLFHPHCEIHHAVNTIVADDTNTSLRGQGSERSVVHTVMNTVQKCFFRWKSFGSPDWGCMFVPTPVMRLPSAKAASFHTAFKSWMLVSPTSVGEHWKRLGCPADLH